jgi:hypothetical protein
MARMRSVKPEFWSDRKIARLSRDARLLYMALWNFADEWGRLHGDTRYIKGHCLPYDDDLSLTAIDGLLDELQAHGRLVRYMCEGDPYLFLVKLAKHQRLEPAKVPSRLPEPPTDGHSTHDTPSSESRANESAPNPDEVAPHDNSSETIVAKHVAGGMLQVAGGREHVVAASGAPTIVGEWIDTCRKRPPQQVIGQTAKLISQMLSEGIDPDDIRRGVVAWSAKGVHPSVLPSVVHEVMNSRPRAARPSTTDAKVAQTLELARTLAERDSA